MADQDQIVDGASIRDNELQSSKAQAVKGILLAPKVLYTVLDPDAMSLQEPIKLITALNSKIVRYYNGQTHKIPIA